MECILKTYKEPIVRTTAFVISYLSLVVSLFPLTDCPLVRKGLLLLSVLALLVFFWMEFTSRPKRRVYLQKDKDKIRQYMFEWIHKGRHAVIFSHNLSWVTGDKIKKLLQSKAKAKELTVYIPNEKDLTNDAKSLIGALRDNGAAVHVYTRCDHVPISRFTITNLNGPGERVAVAYGDGEFHVIEEYSPNEHPAFYMAKDLLAFARSLATPNG